MTTLFTFLVFFIVLPLLPFYGAGWLMKGAAPAVAALVLVLIGRALGWGSGYSFWLFPLQYVLVLVIYMAGGEAKKSSGAEKSQGDTEPSNAPNQ
ncbi:hypothetical protein HJG53_10600 [Sphingomonas sp. ID1715]|uniref:hypothetical protein n=1 Tax=Sphingomonas sp. ID1715 TaxID=1656898 RepID=UPI0014878D8E|nr:hypothetical protein [Sphingomonas sp. ID1715]NNM77354.1 hypothetical protein [Sphingomonas sp. ID1715]